jgi:Initiator Replication protein.
MIFFLKKEKFLLNKRDVTVDFDKRLNKKEYELFTIILNKFSLNADNFISINCDEIFKELKINFNKLEILNKKMLNKSINYRVNDGEKIIISGNFNLLNSFALQEGYVIYSFSDEIKMALREKNFFNRIHLISLLRFKSKHTAFFYMNFLTRLGDFSEEEIELEQLKKFFFLEESYDRFYDFEKNILKPIVEDINNFTEYYIAYDKIRNKSNRIEKIRFKGTNKYSKYIRKKANELLYSVRDYIDDFSLVYNEIYINLMRKGYEYVNNNLIYCLENYKNNFAENFQKVMEENPTNSPVEKEVDMQVFNKV